MRFVITPPERIAAETAQQAYLSGIDRVSWQVQATLDGNELAVRRAVSDSGNLHIPWDVDGHGRLTLSTGSLIERAQPYHLPLELARGTLSRLRSQIGDWQSIGLSVPEKVGKRIHQAMGYLGRAAVTQANLAVCAEMAEKALSIALDAADLLVASYIDQAIAVRRRAGGKLPCLLAGDLGVSLLDDYTARQFLLSFNAAVVPISWREIEASEGSRYWTVSDKQIQWGKKHGLTICGGPLLLCDSRGLPDWVYLWEDDFDSLQSCASEFITAAVTRYRGQVDLWQCAGRLNSADILSLSEEERLRLAAHCVELTRSLDPDTPAVICFDQPWAEYMSHRELDFPPLHFADALIRAGLEMSGLMLEINLGYYPGGTLPRTPLEFSRQLDYWGMLGLPLYVSLTVPSADHDDPLAQRTVKLAAGTASAKTQQAWVARYVPLILSKPYVRGVLWNQLRDSEPHDFPHGGLFDLRRHPKPALRALASIRQAHLR
ncbi:MAG: hypothetical protein JXB62_15480 [Pirellulales bacterium]|nr:hypothetical protein [Pirellulales bacterium]